METSAPRQLCEDDIIKEEVISEDDLERKGTNDEKETIEETTDNNNEKESIEKIADKEGPHEEYNKISAHPDFLCIAQFIGTFGSLLGIPHFFIDTIEDGLNSATSKIDDDDSYLDACGNAVEQLLISLLRRCGVLTNIPKLSSTLQSYFEDRDPHIYSSLGDSLFNNLPRTVKLEILKFVCLSQFDENSRFKTEFNSQYSPDDLRFLPLGRDFESSQYWFISDREKSHRLYRWRYPYTLYTPDQWSLLSTSYSELQRVVERLRPPESEHQLRQGKLWEIVNEQKVDIPVEKPDVKKAKKKKKKDQIEVSDELANEDDLDVEHRIRKYELGMRKSARNVNRKVYTEENETSEEESQHKEYNKAVEIARSRKRSRKHLRISQSDGNKVGGVPANRPLQPDMKMETYPCRKLKQHEKEALADSFINFNDSKRYKTPRNRGCSKDPFAFSDIDSSSRQSEDSSGSLGATDIKLNVKNGQVDNNKRHSIGNCVRKPVQQKCNVTKEFLESVKEIPSLADIKKPAEAEDKCWKCEGEENVDQMLFCDGCDLATYHMACLLPPIEVVPDDDWYCPVCEQVLLYLNLRLNLDKLRIFTYVPHTSRSRPRKCYSVPRSNTCRARPSQHYRPPPRPGPQSGHSLGRTITCNPALITPSRTVNYRYVTPRPRAKIGQIDRLAETARKVFDHSFDEEDTMSPLEHRKVTMLYKTTSYYGKSRYGQNTYLEDSESDCEVVYPEDVESEASSESEFSHRPSVPRGKPLIGQTPPGLIQKAERKYTADDFLAEPTKTTEINKPTSKLGYNPLAAVRSLIRPSNTSVASANQAPTARHHGNHGNQSKDPENSVLSPHTSSRDQRSRDRVTPTARHQATTARHQTPTARHQATTARHQATTARHHGNQTIAHSTTNHVDTATAILEGRKITAEERVEDSRSGNVVMPTSHLSIAQQQALAGWEEDEKRRKKDTFQFDD